MSSFLPDATAATKASLASFKFSTSIGEAFPVGSIGGAAVV